MKHDTEVKADRDKNVFRETDSTTETVITKELMNIMLYEML